jgi:hypothetical protein
MNVRIIDPGRSFSRKLRQWGRSLEDDELGDLDGPEPVRSDDRLELLIDLRALQCQFLEEALAADRIPGNLRVCVVERVDEIRASIGVLGKIAGELGLGLPAARCFDTTKGFAAMEGKPEDADPGFTASGGMGPVMFLNALGLSVVSAFLRDEDAGIWRTALLPMLADDSRFEGRLKGSLAALGEGAEMMGAEWLSLAGSAGSGQSGRVWSFDLLRMGIRRLLGPGFFPVE